jgi:hypothetical protein
MIVHRNLKEYCADGFGLYDAVKETKYIFKTFFTYFPVKKIEITE